jgi:hypothetical protein
MKEVTASSSEFKPALPGKSKPDLDRVNTGSGSDRVGRVGEFVLDPVATAPGTDPIQLHSLKFSNKTVQALAYWKPRPQAEL